MDRAGNIHPERDNKYSCFLSFVNVNFESLYSNVLFGIATEVIKLVTDHSMRLSREVQNNRAEKVKERRKWEGRIEEGV